MEAARHKPEIEAEMQRDAELATLYAGADDVGVPQPLLVGPLEHGTWEEDSELDALIFAGLLRLAP